MLQIVQVAADSLVDLDNDWAGHPDSGSIALFAGWNH
jgi:hypothetical protein